MVRKTTFAFKKLKTATSIGQILVHFPCRFYLKRFCYYIRNVRVSLAKVSDQRVRKTRKIDVSFNIHCCIFLVVVN